MKKWTLEDDSDEEEDKQDNKDNKDEIIEEEVDPLDAFMQVSYISLCFFYYIASQDSAVSIATDYGLDC
jgi:hypothetical protein